MKTRVEEAMDDIVRVVTSEARSIAGSMRHDPHPDLQALSTRLYALCDTVLVKSFDALHPPKDTG